MITEQDRHVGTIRGGWLAYLESTGREGVFVYSSDHGDTCGEHGVFGKQTFYEGSVRIPLLIEGAGLPAGQRLRDPVSILDIGPTLCELTGAVPPPCQDGVSLVSALRGSSELAERFVLGEWVQHFRGQTVPARMIRAEQWKLIHYRHDDIPDQLFDLETDPDELVNRASDRPDVLRRLGDLLESDWAPGRVAGRFAEKAQHAELLNRSYQGVCPPEPETEKWRMPASSTRPPEVMI